MRNFNFLRADFCARALLALTMFTSVPVAVAADIEMWRLDCGEMAIPDISYFSDSFAYDGQSKLISNGCYLIRNGNRYLLWDAGISEDYWKNNKPDEDGWVSSITTTVEDQLKQIKISPAQITFLGISHYHGDHIGQAPDFPVATLLMSHADVQRLRGQPPGNARRRLAHWFDGQATMQNFDRDHDVFGDGSAIILAMPGHTPGHSGLLVRLPQTGPVLLTGDLFHFREELGKRNVSLWNTSRADTLASIERFEAIVKALKPLIIVQHEPADIDLLPAFPNSAK